MATVETKCCDVFPQRTSVRCDICRVSVQIKFLETGLVDGAVMDFGPIDASSQAIDRLKRFIERGLRPPKGKPE